MQIYNFLLIYQTIITTDETFFVTKTKKIVDMTNFSGSWWVLGSLLAGSEVNPRSNPQKQKTVKSLAITNKSVNFAASYGQINPATDLKPPGLFSLTPLQEKSKQ